MKWFTVEGKNRPVTLELEAENEYEVLIDDFHIGGMKTNLGGKLVLGIEFNGRPHKVVVKKR